MADAICPHCQVRLSSEARFCVSCGRSIVPTEHSGRFPAPRDELNLVGVEIAGRYRLLEKLGEGGMGAVYKAEQISLKRKVAVKVLKPALSSDGAIVRRFNAEAEMAARLNHPNTVAIYDFGQHSDGSLFIAMEYVEGASLRRVLLRDAPMPIARSLGICQQIAASLIDAHTNKIVHRDLKPDNVMLTERGKQRDIVRVLDFGIAKLRDEQRDAMTRQGDLIGTPQYMAPEQIRGEQVDGRTDVYALGAMLFEMITGRLPFEAETVVGILSKHLVDPPEPPSARRPELRIPAHVDALVLDALAKAPDDRIASMERFAERLTDALSSATGPMAVARPPGVPTTSRFSAPAAPVAPVAGSPLAPPSPYAPPYAPPPAAVPPPAGPGFNTPVAAASRSGDALTPVPPAYPPPPPAYPPPPPAYPPPPPSAPLATPLPVAAPALDTTQGRRAATAADPLATDGVPVRRRGRGWIWGVLVVVIAGLGVGGYFARDKIRDVLYGDDADGPHLAGERMKARGFVINVPPEGTLAAGTDADFSISFADGAYFQCLPLMAGGTDLAAMVSFMDRSFGYDQIEQQGMETVGGVERPWVVACRASGHCAELISFTTGPSPFACLYIAPTATFNANGERRRELFFDRIQLDQGSS